MRTTIIITKHGDDYASNVWDSSGGGQQDIRCGITAYDAATSAARLMIQYAQCNPEGGDLMAPTEVLDLVPAHLRSIARITAPSP